MRRLLCVRVPIWSDAVHRCAVRTGLRMRVPHQRARRDNRPCLVATNTTPHFAALSAHVCPSLRLPLLPFWLCAILHVMPLTRAKQRSSGALSGLPCTAALFGQFSALPARYSCCKRQPLEGVATQRRSMLSLCLCHADFAYLPRIHTRVRIIPLVEARHSMRCPLNHVVSAVSDGVLAPCRIIHAVYIITSTPKETVVV